MNPEPNPTGETRIVVALGSNLGDSTAMILRSMERLQSFAASPVTKSSLWKSTPVDCPPGSPMFVNAAAVFTARPGETPETLLEKLQSLERMLGRQPRAVYNQARVIDLDLIAFGNEQRSSPWLTLPHPRAHLRQFVLKPLNEIAPELVLPGRQESISQLLGKLPPDDTEVLKNS